MRQKNWVAADIASQPMQDSGGSTPAESLDDAFETLLQSAALAAGGEGGGGPCTAGSPPWWTSKP